MQTVQIIIPLYNDQDLIAPLLSDLFKKGWAYDQIMIVDASEKNPYPVENSFGVSVIHQNPAERGRASQMNTGAAKSNSDILLFLHADTRLPRTAAIQIAQAVSRGYVGGGFSRRFDSPSLFLQVSCFFADLRGKHLGWFFGDQAIFCTKEAFTKVGGYPEIFPFEDLDFSRQLKKHGPLCLLSPGIRTSARRFQAEGPGRRTWKDLLLTLGYFLNIRS